MSRLLALVVVALVSLTAACSDDCDALVDSVCERLGESHDDCQRARKRNESASHDDKRLCGEALALTQRLTPKN